MRLWEALDADADGIICASELVWFDLNGNGKFDNAEADAFSRVAASKACELVIRFDWNRDGFLDGDELGAMNKAVPLAVGPGGAGVGLARGMFERQQTNLGAGRRPQETRSEVLARDFHFALLLNSVTPSPGSPETTPGRGYPTIMSQTNPSQPIDGFQRGWFLNAINRPRPDTKAMQDARDARLLQGKQ